MSAPHFFEFTDARGEMLLAHELRTGETYAITYNPAHQWYWFPRMRREEALVFKVYDSVKDGRARFMLSAKSTRLTLSGELFDAMHSYTTAALVAAATAAVNWILLLLLPREVLATPGTAAIASS